MSRPLLVTDGWVPLPEATFSDLGWDPTYQWVEVEVVEGVLILTPIAPPASASRPRPKPAKKIGRL